MPENSNVSVADGDFLAITRKSPSARWYATSKQHCRMPTSMCMTTTPLIALPKSLWPKVRLYERNRAKAKAT